MVITNSNQQGKSVVNEDIYISYSIRFNGADEIRELSGNIIKNDVSVGFVSHDFSIGATRFMLNSDTEFAESEKKQLFGVFIDDIEQLST